MEKAKKLPFNNCGQIYSLWLTEPELISLYDLRPFPEFAEAHIPGSLHSTLQSLEKAGINEEHKIPIFILPTGSPLTDSQELESLSPGCFIIDWATWLSNDLPTTGQSLNKTLFRFKNTKGNTVSNEIIFHQLFEASTSTYTYLIADKKTREAAIIDPVLETVDRDLKLIEELGLKLLYALDTHIHADHITGAGELRKRTRLKTAISKAAGATCADVDLEEGQQLLLGNKIITVIETPGHTNTCLTFAFEGRLFTGDSLLIRTCGRTDFQQGSPEKLFHSIREKLFRFPDETLIYPGHDYRGLTCSTIREEKLHNARLKESIDLPEFKKIMAELSIPKPKNIHKAVPANLACGELKDQRRIHPQIVDGTPEISAEDLLGHASAVDGKNILLIDVRRPDEFNGELGHIRGAQLITLGPDLTTFLEKGDRNQEIVFICRSGGRSGTATNESIKLGYYRTINLVGGMIYWNEKKYPVERN